MRCDWYVEDDHAHPHYGHTLQTWGDGAWLCATCEGVMCDNCRENDVKSEGDLCGECISEQAEYWADARGENDNG